MRVNPDLRLLIVGINRPNHVGSYFATAAKQLSIHYEIIDAEKAEASNRIARIFHWHCLGKRPARLDNFGQALVEVCKTVRPTLLLTTGRAPLGRLHIQHVQRRGTRVVNFSTDDPWNSALYAPWFLSALPSYDIVFTTRRANIDDFVRCGVPSVHYLPFAYDPTVHRPWTEDEPIGAPSDVLFVGGCDSDRLPLISALIDAGIEVGLFGGYWDKHPKTRPYWRGMGDQNTIRLHSKAARICLCLVRRANRDGHVMRSYEAAAIGGCILAEDTEDHRQLFGPEDYAVCYFSSVIEMVEKAKILLNDAKRCERLSIQLQARFASGRHTYADRLHDIVRLSLDDRRVR
jgi:hypothetical protein